MSNLGQLEKIDLLREIWGHEAQNFTPWLAKEENLKLLSKAVHINIVQPECESSVGTFNVDIFAKEKIEDEDENEGRTIIIENQLGQTDHDHLGKIITYAAGKSAGVVIWIVKRARDEHRKAIEWLNQLTGENVSFFLIEIEIWRIGESLPAVNFNIVEKPNGWANIIKKSTGISDTKILQRQFWQELNEYAFNKDELKSQFKEHGARADYYHFFHIENSKNRIRMEANTRDNNISIAFVERTSNELYNKLHAKKSDVEKFIGCTLQWIEEPRRCRILAERHGDIKKNDEEWPLLFDWLCEMALKFKEMVKKFDT